MNWYGKTFFPIAHEVIKSIIVKFNSSLVFFPFFFSIRTYKSEVGVDDVNRRVGLIYFNGGFKLIEMNKIVCVYELYKSS